MLPVAGEARQPQERTANKRKEASVVAEPYSSHHLGASQGEIQPGWRQLEDAPQGSGPSGDLKHLPAGGASGDMAKPSQQLHIK